MQRFHTSRFLTHLALIFIPIGFFLISGCTAQPPAITQVDINELNAAPQLSRFTRFDLTSQASGIGGEQKINGSLNFNVNAASFEVSAPKEQAAGRFYVQPEACRDDPSPDCKRSFVVTGQLSALNTTLNCFIPVRNDTATGYIGQSLVGICRDRNGRTFSITIFSN